MTTNLKLGTRGSPLALAQANMVAGALAVHGTTCEIVVITTTGDRVQDRPLAEIGGKALWTKELDAALIDRRIDFAVHSMKDVETDLNDGVALAAMMPRADVRDRLIGTATLGALRHGAKVGTSSPRRAAQLLARRPDLVIEMLRGNVATRLARIAAGDFDATLLAAAGLDRLGIDAGHALEIDDWLPAPAQGAVGIAIRKGDAAVGDAVARIDDADTHAAVLLERHFLACLDADCHSPVAALARVADGSVSFSGEIIRNDGTERQHGATHAPLAGARDAVALLAAELLARASPELRAQFGE
ncbi:hydroxymethylbilane synthase [Glacieibacterium frigidum]|uniref:Porphobilinogen deaminase n=1 Tax=Glacieibacterium frigidum TaxID=2593303 RepID=A0A552UFB2_9SPHN|nr:hydroxymethylbilane synthase [Glacieibacterium frigidum]TRW16905.1 hydroxymethylbilane synthase [Glacieibacterium frigidum]